MNKTIYLVILFVIGLVSSVNAEVSKEDPFFGVGSDFLVVRYSGDNPDIYTLFDNTNIYLDNNNDGIWDYQFQGNAGESQILDTPWPIYNGARIHTDKPIMYKQLLYHYECSYDPCDEEIYITIPPLNNLKSEYYFYYN